jgi:predicted molibdopterin-dependent oxidoreductase YjgC
LGGILRSIVDQGLEETDWLEEHSENPATLQYALRGMNLDQVVRATNVPLDSMNEAARLFAEADGGAIVYGLDNVAADLQRDCVRALADLAMFTGNLGKDGCGLYPMRRGANEQGAWDMGCYPDRLPGYRLVGDEEAGHSVEAVWGASLPTAPGVSFAQALSGEAGGVRAALVIGEGAVPWEDLDFLAVQTGHLGPTAQRADLVLPRVTFAQKNGTFTNLERRIQLLRPVFPNSNTKAEPNSGADGARTEAWVIEQLAGRMGADGFSFGSPAGIMDEIALVTPIYGGISHRRLEREGRLVLASNPESPQPTQVLYSRKEYRGIQWPCPDDAAPGVGVLYRDGFPSEKGHPITPEFRAASGGDEAENPMWLVPGRVLIQRERDLEVVKGLTNQIVREDWIELNPADANRLSIVDGDQVEVASAARTLSGVARLVPGVPAGVIAVTGLFGQLAIDLQASEEWNPAAESPRLEIAPASIAKVSAGSAA